MVRIPRKRPIREKLYKKRKRVGGLQFVTSNEPSASIVGYKPRPPKKLVHRFHREQGLVDPERDSVKAKPLSKKFFRDRIIIRYSRRLMRPMKVMASRLTGDSIEPARPPVETTQDPKEKEKKKGRKPQYVR